MMSTASQPNYHEASAKHVERAIAVIGSMKMISDCNFMSVLSFLVNALLSPGFMPSRYLCVDKCHTRKPFYLMLTHSLGLS